MSRNLLFPAALLVLVCLFLVDAVAHAQTGVGEARNLQQTFISIAKRLKPSVVNIRVVKEEKVGSTGPGMAPFRNSPDATPFDDLLEKFFRGQPGRPFRGPRRPFRSEAAGSGIIIDRDGHILTNNHVIKGGTKIVVKLASGKEHDAKVIGRDPQTDLAVIKIKAGETLIPAEFADTAKLEVGQWVMAIGNPFGLEQTVTVGVLSAMGRSGLGAAPIEDFLQTDASINPGNSGGPLCDLDGRVIGVNTLIFAAPGSGIGFAIPANMAQRITRDIIAKGKVERPYIGISMQAVTSDLQEHFNLSDRSGAVIMEVRPDSPGAKAGLQQMDIIRKVDGNLVTDTNDVQKQVLSRSVGSTLELELLRNGAPVKVTVKLEQMPKAYGLAETDGELEGESEPGEAAGEPGGADRLGLTVQPLTPDLAQQLGTKLEKGLVVTGVNDGGPADRAGVLARDIVTQVNGKPVATAGDLAGALAAAKNPNSHLLVVQRGSSPLFLVVKEKE